MKKIIFTTFLALLAAQSSVKAVAPTTILADWDFDTIGAQAQGYNTAPATSGVDVSTASATQLGMTNSYTFNTGEGPGSTAGSDVLASAGASTGSGSFGWRVRGNSNSSGAGAGNANGWNSQAPIGTQGAQFNVNTTGYSSLSLTFDLNATGQAERNLTVEYTLNDSVSSPTWQTATITSGGSLDSSVFTNSTSANTILGNYVELSGSGTGWNNQITANFGTAAANDPNFAFEIVNASTGTDDVNTSGNALNNSSGNWRYDNVEITGVVAAPEPSTWALGGLSLLALFALLRRKSRQA